MDAVELGLLDYFQKVCSSIGKYETGISNIILLSNSYKYQCHYDVYKRKILFNEDSFNWMIQVKWDDYAVPNSCQSAQSEWIYTRPISHKGEHKYFLAIVYPEKNNKKILQILELLAKQLSYQLVTQPNLKSLFLQSKYQQQITNTIEEGYLTVDQKGMITFINQTGTSILGLDENELVGQPLVEMLPNFNPSPLVTLQTKENWVNREVSFHLPKGKIHLIFSVTPLFENGLPVGIVITFREMKIIMKKLESLVSITPIFQFEDIIYKSRSMQDLVKTAKVAAKTESNILIEGESGTGKELIAQAIHNQSQRKGKPFVVIDCSSIPRDLVESELFGYVDGAFTGARKGGRLGKFEVANGGTVFLDEIGEMPLEIQVKLLRVLQTRTITRVGGHDPTPCNVRIIAATNRNLEEEVEYENFRLDLYYRLNVLQLTIPPIREREGDIPLLAKTLVEVAANRSNRHSPTISLETMEILENYSWPGNIRELENVIERAILIAHDVMEPEHLPNYLLTALVNSDKRKPAQSINLNNANSIREKEKELIRNTLDHVYWNKSLAARKLGISRSNLYEKIAKYNIEQVNR
ncbi:sigma 54-interacting transcriptional regulator [Neobacillus sp. 179-C4.2 HS]|uniref:Sigma 54-interacting transcriptional regulator n=1 Tax=Neobacillus driksii TaxID=3035913 RepID=A0ABV4YWE0_9BACI|nr:sigma 54-interacting transcriptional regulator [Neobacillus sp. 179.-C4.2 HS]MDP5192866.1 sigma 54-interacting transcriptional regulator [Neobacillus sp. 179.-C4.2 HS]